MSNVRNNTPSVAVLATAASSTALLDPAALDATTQRATEEFLAEGTPANTARSYASAMRYWSAWYALRYGGPLHTQPVPVPVVNQFVVDHLERRVGTGLRHELPPALDAQLVALGVKKALGPLSSATVGHRLAVLAKWHRLQHWESPTDDHRIKMLVAKARRAQAKRGVVTRKKTAAVAEPLQAMLDTCTDGLRGARDRALLLLAWSGGGRRRSEVVALQVSDLRRLRDDTWTYALGRTKTHAAGPRREKPLRGQAARAVAAWLEAANLTEGPLFRRMFRYGSVGSHGLSSDQVARIVQRRAKLAGLEGDWAAHSLRSGFVTEAGRQGVPLGEVMAMTEHRSVGTVMGYFQAGSLLGSRASALELPGGAAQDGLITVPDFKAPTD
jgi:integrase